jgi:hypothetical protein
MACRWEAHPFADLPELPVGYAFDGDDLGICSLALAAVTAQDNSIQFGGACTQEISSDRYGPRRDPATRRVAGSSTRLSSKCPAVN